VKLFRQTGKHQRKVKKRVPEVVNAVEEKVKYQPNTSLRHLSRQVNLSAETCRTILKKDLLLYPYRTTSVPALLADDPSQRLQFCE
jgi:hypothetical protein